MIGLFFGQPGEGFKLGKQVAEVFHGAIGVLSDVFDFLGLHFGPANCNGEVLSDTLTFLPGEMAQAVDRPASRDYTGSQGNERCGSPPEWCGCKRSARRVKAARCIDCSGRA